MAQSLERPRILQIFISYAHDDEIIANSVYGALRKALGSFFADIFLDKMSIDTGLDFKNQIENRLDSTDVFIIIYTGAERHSHDYTGWEVGYFRKVQRQEKSDLTIGRRIIPMYLYNPPVTETSIQGIALGITRDDLSRSTEEFARLIVNSNDPMVKFVEELQETVHQLIEQAGFPKTDLPNPVQCVVDMRFSIFSHLKTTVDKILRPQKQIIIKTNVASLQVADDSLPDDAQLEPIGSGSPMTIFGLPNEPIQWSAFILAVQNRRLGDSWRNAINSVVASSLPDEINVDNSQIIVSEDEQHIYRIILTTSTTYFNGNKEFYLYLVEGLRPLDYGDRETTLLLKGLQIVCRFRFMFLESSSEFYSQNILLIGLDKVKRLIRRMIMELDLLRRDASIVGLDQPNIWSQFVTYVDLRKMTEDWIPRDRKIREIAENITHYNGDINGLESMRKELADEIDDMDQVVRPQNKLLVKQILEKLQKIVDREYERV